MHPPLIRSNALTALLSLLLSFTPITATPTGNPTITLTNKLNLPPATSIPDAPPGWVIANGAAIDPQIIKDQKKNREIYEEAVRSGKIAAPHRGPLPSGCKYQRVRDTSCDATKMMGGCVKDVRCCLSDCDSARFTARKAFGDFVDGVFVVGDLKEGEMPVVG